LSVDQRTLTFHYIEIRSTMFRVNFLAEAGGFTAEFGNPGRMF